MTTQDKRIEAARKCLIALQKSDQKATTMREGLASAFAAADAADADAGIVRVRLKGLEELLSEYFRQCNGLARTDKENQVLVQETIADIAP